MDNPNDVSAELLKDPEVGSDLVADRFYRALEARDARFDGRFFVGVTTTGIFCRPICPAPTPKPAHCTYWRSAAAAQGAGFRPCLRCRPEVAPGTPAWRGTAASVSRALRLIEAGALDGGGNVEALANRLGIGPRHLRRLFDQHLGTTPRAVAKMRRALFAKQLVTETALPMTDVALAAGFTSQRRFNACMQDVYGRSPTALRDSGRGRAARRRAEKRAGPGKVAAGDPLGSAVARERRVPKARALTLAIPYRPPLAWSPLLDFVRDRAIPGVEAVEDGRYARSFRQGTGFGSLAVTHDSERACLQVDVVSTSLEGLIDLGARVRRLFDVDADGEAIDGLLRRAPRLRDHVARVPGLRVPGAFDAFETAVRAVLGQQVSVKGATTLSGRIASRWGDRLPEELAITASLRQVFPTPEDLTEAPLEEVGLTRARAETIRGLARAVLEDPDLMRGGAGLEDARARWEALAGIGPWTASYVAMRVLREPDALPAGDLGLRKAIAKAGEKPPHEREVEKSLEGCRPYRAYAAMRLWALLGEG